MERIELEDVFDDRPTTGGHIDFDKTSAAAVVSALEADGYGRLTPRVEEIIHAGQHGCLLWTARRLTTTDGSRIDARPEGEQ